jgi:hypothetical protein
MTPLTKSLSEESSHTLEDTVLLGVIRVIFAGDFEDGREGVGEGIDAMADALSDLLNLRLDMMRQKILLRDSRGTHVLVDQEDSNVLSLLREVLESLLNLRCLGLGIDD